MSAPTFEPVPCCVFRYNDGTLWAVLGGVPVLFHPDAKQAISCGTFLPAVVIPAADYADLLHFRALHALPSQGLENQEQYRQEAELRTHEDLKRQYVATRLLLDVKAWKVLGKSAVIDLETTTQRRKKR